MSATASLTEEAAADRRVEGGAAASARAAARSFYEGPACTGSLAEETVVPSRPSRDADPLRTAQLLGSAAALGRRSASDVSHHAAGIGCVNHEAIACAPRPAPMSATASLTEEAAADRRVEGGAAASARAGARSFYEGPACTGSLAEETVVPSRPSRDADPLRTAQLLGSAAGARPTLGLGRLSPRGRYRVCKP